MIGASGKTSTGGGSGGARPSLQCLSHVPVPTHVGAAPLACMWPRHSVGAFISPDVDNMASGRCEGALSSGGLIGA